MFSHCLVQKSPVRSKASADESQSGKITSFMTKRNAVLPIRQIVLTGVGQAFSAEEAQQAIHINSQLLSGYGSDWRSFKALAKSSGSFEVKFEAYSQIIADTSVPVDMRLWATNNLGYQYIKARDFNRASKVLQPVIDQLQKSDDAAIPNEIAGKILNNYGWSEFKRGNIQAAEWSFESAVDKGYIKARTGIQQIRNAVD
jgi:hypothetical protein